MYLSFTLAIDYLSLYQWTDLSVDEYNYNYE